jgi:hypothetical protein
LAGQLDNVIEGLLGRSIEDLIAPQGFQSGRLIVERGETMPGLVLGGGASVKSGEPI